MAMDGPACDIANLPLSRVRTLLSRAFSRMQRCMKLNKGIPTYLLINYYYWYVVLRRLGFKSGGI